MMSKTLTKLQAKEVMLRLIGSDRRGDWTGREVCSQAWAEWHLTKTIDPHTNAPLWEYSSTGFPFKVSCKSCGRRAPLLKSGHCIDCDTEREIERLDAASARLREFLPLRRMAEFERQVLEEFHIRFRFSCPDRRYPGGPVRLGAFRYGWLGTDELLNFTDESLIRDSRWFGEQLSKLSITVARGEEFDDGAPTTSDEPTDSDSWSPRSRITSDPQDTKDFINGRIKPRGVDRHCGTLLRLMPEVLSRTNKKGKKSGINHEIEWFLKKGAVDFNATKPQLEALSNRRRAVKLNDRLAVCFRQGFVNEDGSPYRKELGGSPYRYCRAPCGMEFALNKVKPCARCGGRRPCCQGTDRGNDCGLVICSDCFRVIRQLARQRTPLHIGTAKARNVAREDIDEDVDLCGWNPIKSRGAVTVWEYKPKGNGCGGVVHGWDNQLPEDVRAAAIRISERPPVKPRPLFRPAVQLLDRTFLPADVADTIHPSRIHGARPRKPGWIWRS